MYKYLLIDGQYILTRNFKLMSSRYNKITPEWLCTITYQSVAKLRRDLIDFEVPIFIFDTAPYYKSNLISDYKGSRHYYTDKDLEGITDEDEIARINREIELNKIKSEAKILIKDLFPKLGIECVYYDGWEADDLAYLMTKILSSKSALFSSDDDWRYLVSETVDRINPKGGITTYEGMIDSINVEVFNKINNLQYYKGYIDSIYGSHNDLKQTLNNEYKRTNSSIILSEILNNDFSKLTDKDLFLNQLKTFRLHEYPMYDDVLNYLRNKIREFKYKQLTNDEFLEIVKSNNLRISYSYYNEFIKNLNYE